MLVCFAITDTCNQQIAETVQRGIATYRQESWSHEWDFSCNGHSEVCSIIMQYSYFSISKIWLIILMAVGNGLDVMLGRTAFSQKYKVFGMMSCHGSVRHHF